MLYRVSPGFPAVGVEFTYRNPRSEVVRFLEDRHAGNYFVYNFCAEEERWYVRCGKAGFERTLACFLHFAYRM